MPERARIVVAVPKGRILKELTPRFEAAGLDVRVLTKPDRRLVREDKKSGVGFLLLKPDDVPTYVEYGAADLGVVGRDVLLERDSDLYAPLDLGIGRCKLVVAGLPGAPVRGEHLRVATKYPTLAAQHFHRHGQPVEIIYVQGSVELAPVTGLAELIVDIVESGETLRQNGLVELEWVMDISSVVVANRAGLKLKRERIRPLLEALKAPSGR